MPSWRKVCTILAVVLLAVILLLNYFGSPLTRYQLERQVADYLQELGYQQEDLAELNSVYDRHARNKYMVKVVFADAPKAAHYYYYDEELELQEVEQIGK